MRPQYDVPLPMRLRGRPRDHRGYIVPFFVTWFDTTGTQCRDGEGTPDFRVISPKKWNVCLRERKCWLCGQPLGKYLTFAIGPMCAITRTTSEPACHLDCARYAAQVCPFMIRPKMVRNEKDLPVNRSIPGISLDRNPGVMCLWTTLKYTVFRDHTGKGKLIQVGDPENVEWWAQARRATRSEIMDSVDGGLPILREMAQRDGLEAVKDLEVNFMPRFERLLPLEG